MCLLLIALAAPTVAAAAPAVDEYTFDFPDAEGDRRSDAAPTPRPPELPPEVLDQLSGAEDEAPVESVTARELGAPSSNDDEAEDDKAGSISAETGDRTPVDAAVSASTEDGVLPLLVVLAAIGAMAAVVAIRHRVQGQGQKRGE